MMLENVPPSARRIPWLGSFVTGIAERLAV
jgi:hypothetical protein